MLATILSILAIFVSGISVMIHITIYNSSNETEQKLKHNIELKRRTIELQQQVIEKDKQIIELLQALERN